MGAYNAMIEDKKKRAEWQKQHNRIWLYPPKNHEGEKMKTYYTIAQRIDRTYGHGDFGVEYHICTEELYNIGDYPPLFKTKKKAEEYGRNLSDNGRMIVVEMKTAK